MNKFEQINKYFDHIYVITLERATERHRKIEKELHGLNFKFFYGADCKNFSVQALINEGIYNEDLAKKNHRYGKPIKPGMLGCSLSHKMVYEDIVEKKYSKALVLEDDVYATKFIDLFITFMQELPKNWDLIYFDYNKNVSRNIAGLLKQQFYKLLKLTGNFVWSYSTINNLYAKPFSQHLKIAGYHDFTSAYALTNIAAQKLINIQTPIIFFPDNLLAHASTNNLINSFITIPKMFEQESQDSNKNVESYVGGL